MRRYILVNRDGSDTVEVLEGMEADVERYRAAGWRLVEGELAGAVANSQVEDVVIPPPAWETVDLLDAPPKKSKK